MNNIYTRNCPHIDLHGETLATLDYIVESFLKDNIKMGNRFVAIIHGWNSTILKRRVHELLKNNKKVKSFYVDIYNIGQTIVELDIV